MNMPTIAKAAALALAMTVASKAPAGEAVTPVGLTVARSPASAVARLNNGTGGFCTAVLIERDLAVTASHCLYNFRTKRWIAADSLHLLLGFDRGDYGFHTRGVRYQTGGYDPEDQDRGSRGDWALVRLKEKAPKGFAVMAQAKADPVANDAFRTLGFGTPRKFLLQEIRGCFVLGMSEGFVVSRCPTAPGMSGGPLVDEESGELTGIQVGVSGTGDDAKSVAIPASAWAATQRGLE